MSKVLNMQQAQVDTAGETKPSNISLAVCHNSKISIARCFKR